jgi:hypothetical protein
MESKEKETRRTCMGTTPGGEPCRAAPGKESEYCFLHDPELVDMAQAARRAGGQRLRKEAALIVAFQLLGLDSVRGLRRLLEIATLDALANEDPASRVRQLVYIVQTATGLHKVDTDERLSAIESVQAERAVEKLIAKRLRRAA